MAIYSGVSIGVYNNWESLRFSMSLQQNMPAYHSMHQISQTSPNCKYQFNYNAYKGIDNAPAMEQLVKSCCHGCTLYNQKRCTKTNSGLLWSFYCNHYPMAHLKSKKNFEPGTFMKTGAIQGNFKGRRGTDKLSRKSAFKPIGNSQMKSKQTK